MNIQIRKSLPSDATSIIPLIIDAIGDIANRLTGEKTPEATEIALQQLFIRADNRHSYLNTYVAVDQHSKFILGTLVVYSGQDALEMDHNLSEWLTNKQAPTNRIDQEAHEDEYYIDTICVHPNARGKGVGTMLLSFAEQVARDKNFCKLSLNVETTKERALKLYERQGFVITEPWSIIDEPFHHMVKNLD